MPGATQPERLCSIPSATGAVARLACARLREFGKDAEAVIAKAGALPAQVNDDAVRLEVAKQIKILELVAEALQDRLLGFHLARSFDLREVGLVYYVIASSAQLDEALLNGKRYCAIVNQGFRVDLRQDSQSVSIMLDYVDIDRASDRHQIEFWLVTTVRICRQVTDTRLAPRLIRIKHQRDVVPTEFKTFFGCDIEFGADSDEIVFPPMVASLPVTGRDQYLNNLLRKYAEAALADRTQAPTTLRSTIEDAMTQLLPHGKATLPNVAEQLAISSRTLSRRLSDEGLTFKGILDDTRIALAKRYLAERDLPIVEVAWLLGYREVSSFFHAFKRLTGLTPRQFRMAMS
jgi:AraC-like DNA-binding protein